MSEVDRRNSKCWAVVTGRELPTHPGDPLKRFGRHETLDSSVSMGNAQLTRRYTLGGNSDDDEPGAGECGYS